MAKTVTIILGIFFLLIGILGFIPSVTVDGMLFRVFHVNLAHNIIHLVTGVIALYCGFTSYCASKYFLKVFGIIYGIVAILGFVYGDQDILKIVANNAADTWLHLVVALIALYFGFVCCHDEKCVR